MREGRGWLLLVVMASMPLAGCSVTVGGDPDLGPLVDQAVAQPDWRQPDGWPPYSQKEMEDAVRAYAEKYCPLSPKCDGNYIRVEHGTVQDCVDHFVANAAVFFAWGSTETLDSLRACTADIDSWTCLDYIRIEYESTPRPACSGFYFGKGQLPDGSPCGVWSQCQSGRCLSSVGDAVAACGTCHAVAPLGGDCDFALECPGGATCSGQRCVALGEEGADCVAGSASPRPCHNYLVCGPDSKCIPPPADLGCTVKTGCSLLYSNFYVCNGDKLKCEPIPLSPLGGTCGLGAVCEPQLTCTLKNGVSTCQPRIADGQPCDAKEHPFERTIGFGYDGITPADGCQHGACYQGICQRHGALDCHP